MQPKTQQLIKADPGYRIVEALESEDDDTLELFFEPIQAWLMECDTLHSEFLPEPEPRVIVYPVTMFGVQDIENEHGGAIVYPDNRVYHHASGWYESVEAWLDFMKKNKERRISKEKLEKSNP